MKTQLKIQLLGSSFTIQSDEHQGQVEEVVMYLSAKIEEVREKNPGVEPIKIALLAALNVVDELYKLKKQLQETGGPSRNTGDQIDRITHDLIEKIDKILVETENHSSSPANAE